MTIYGFKLNGGAADGSDSAYEYGAKLAYDFLCELYQELPKHDYARVMSIMMPWTGYNGRPSTTAYPLPDSGTNLPIAKKYHAKWDALSSGGKNMMARNVSQILGLHLNEIVNFMICYTQDGANHASKTSWATGGTGQAIRICSDYDVNVYNIGNPSNNATIENKVANACAAIKLRYGVDVIQYIDKKIFEHQPFAQLSGDFVNAMTTGQYDILVHGSNCQNTMGAGFAKAIKTEFPEAYTADCKTLKGDKKKLGTYSHALVERGDNKFNIINAYSQYRWGRQLVLHSDYQAIRDILKNINKNFPKGKILMPRIGCGLANGCWITVSNIIATELKGWDITIIGKME